MWFSLAVYLLNLKKLRTENMGYSISTMIMDDFLLLTAQLCNFKTGLFNLINSIYEISAAVHFQSVIFQAVSSLSLGFKVQLCKGETFHY